MGFIIKWTIVAHYITLHRECFGQSYLVPENSTKLQTTKIAVTDKNYDNMVYTQTASIPTTMSYTIHADQNENATNKALQMQNDFPKTSNVSDTINKEKKLNVNQPTLERIVHLLNTLKYNTTVVGNKVHVPNTSAVSETESNSNTGQLHSNDMEYFKNILGYIANLNNTTKQNTTKGQVNTESISQKSPEDLENNGKFQGSSGIKAILQYLNVLPPSYNVREPMTPNPPTVNRLPQLKVNNADLIDYNFLTKSSSVDLDPQNTFINLNKQEPLTDQEENNIENLMKNIELPLHTNKRELNALPFHETNSQLIKKLGGAAASEFYPRISDIGQSSNINERDLNDISSFKDKTQVYNNNFVEKPQDKTNIAKLEDWYSNFFKDNIELAPSLSSNKNEKELAKESLFDATYNTFNNDNKQAAKSKEIQYLDYNPIRGSYNSPKMKPVTPHIQQEDELFDINSLFNNIRATEKSKDKMYPFFKSKALNPDFAGNIPSPSRDNDDDENLSAIDRSKKKPLVKKLFLMNQKLELNSAKNRYNEGDTLNMDQLENEDYEQPEGIKDAPFIGNKPSRGNFISGFRKENTAYPVNKGLLLNNNDEYDETPKEFTLPENYQPLKPRANNGKRTDQEFEIPKIIPPFLENNLKPKRNDALKKPNAKVIHKNDEVEQDTTVFNEDPPINLFKKNKNKVITQPQDNMQYNPQLDRNTVIQGDKLRLIKNSLQYINQILAMNEEVHNSSKSYNEYTTSKNINFNKNKTAKLNVIKQRKNKLLSQVIPTNHSDTKSMKNMKGIPADFIKQIAESVKNIILKDIQKEISTETPKNSTTPIATTVTTVKTTVSTTENTTVATEKQEEHKARDANYVVQKILELFKELKSGTEGTTSTTILPKLETHVTKYVYSPAKNGQLPPMPAYNPYGIKPEIAPTNFTDPYKQAYGNHQNNSNMDSLQPEVQNQTSEIVNQPKQMLNQPQQMTNQSPRILNHRLQTFSQPPQFYNQPQFMFNNPPQLMMLNQLPQSFPVKYPEPQPPQFMNQAPQMTNQKLQIINQPPQVTNQAPQPIYHYPPMLNQSPQISYEPVQMMNQPPIFTNPALQSIYHFPQILNRDEKMINHQSQIMNQAPPMVKETLQTPNRSPQMFHQPQQIMNYAQQINQPEQKRNQAPQTLNNFAEAFNQPSEIFNQPSKNVNHAQEILNQALQMKNQASQMIYDSPEISNQSPQIDNRPQAVSNQGLQMGNRVLQMMNNYPEIWNQRQKRPNPLPQILNQAPQMMHRSSETKDPAPQITMPITNAFNSPPYVTFQTNSNEIPPLGIPLDKPKRLINRVIIVPTKGPVEIRNEVREQPKEVGEPREVGELAQEVREPKIWLNEKRKQREQNRPDLTKKLRVSDRLKHYESREPSRNRSILHRVNSFYKNYSGNRREPYKQRYREKSPDYESVQSRHPGVKKFHEQLERMEDWSKSDRKRSRERVKECSDNVPSRQQVPLTKIKQRFRYDDTHFRNFLKTQEKVNDMLEAILATKKAGRPRSVETP